MIEFQSNIYKQLKNRKIIDILIGDSEYGNTDKLDDIEISISMPYLTGSDLCSLSTLFGLPRDYCWKGNVKSRWEYLSDLMDHCIQEDKSTLLLNYLFDKERFENKLTGLSIENTARSYNEIIKKVLDQINGILYYSETQLVQINGNYIIKSTEKEVQVYTSEIKTVNQEYIRSIAERAIYKIEQGSFDNAITKSRTLLEEVFIYAIEKKGEEPPRNGKINQLYRDVKTLYNMHADNDMDIRIKKLLSGLESIVSGVSEMRNQNSDSHGMGSKRIGIEKHHATLLVNSSMTMAQFILSVVNNNVNI